MFKNFDMAGFTVKATIILFVTLLNAVLVMWLWNLFLVPTIDGVKEISIVTSMGLIGLFGILFKDMGVHLNWKD